jgi:tetratricopeptide (TPR) repeat protein
MHCLVWGGVPVARKGAGMAAERGGSADGLRAAQQDEPAENLAGAPDGGTNPAGAPDGEMNPAGAPDGGTDSAGLPDGGMNPAGAPDGGMNPAGLPDGGMNPAGAPDGEIRQEISVARRIRAQCLASGRTPAETAAVIHDQCGPVFGTTWIRARRMALGIALADVVAQIRARYEAEGRTPPRFSETLLSAYESAQKRPGPEYLHYLCAVYQAEPEDLGYQDPCFCGNRHRKRADLAPATDAVATGRRLTAVRPVPAPRDGTGAAGGGLPPAGGGGAVTPVTLVPAAAWGEGLEAGGAWGKGLEAGGAWGEGPGARGEADDDVVRRALLRLIADAGTPVDGRFFGAADRVRRRMDDALLGGSVSATMLDQWEDTACGYGRQYRSAPPLRLLCDVLLDLGDVRRMCEERQPLDFAERLCRLAARLAALSGMTMINIGDQRLARAFFRTARIAADETGDRHLRGWVAVRESLVPLYYGDPGEAARLARVGGDLAGRTSSVAGVMAPVMEARALAKLASGENHSAREALRRAKAALDRAHLALGGLAGEVHGDTAFGYTERQLLFHQGDALVSLGDHKGAENAFEQSLQMYSRCEILDRSLITLGQARCRLEADEPEEALRLSRDTVLALPRQHRSGLVVRTARSLGESAAARHGDLPAIREYREALLTG